MFHRILTVVPILACVCSLFRSASAAPPVADRAAWAAVDIVPMPKRIELSGRDVDLAGGVIVLGTGATEQDRIGADWINGRLTSRSAERLRVVTAEEIPQGAPVVIYVGTRASSEVVGRAARAGLFQLGPRDPGERGYVVHWQKTGKREEAYLGGADPVGALYACVTFAELLRGEADGVRVRQAEVVDWPDFPMCTEGISLRNPETRQQVQAVAWGMSPTPKELEAYVKARRAHIDRLLRWKFTAMNSREVKVRWRREVSDHQPSRDAIREVNAYAKARGVRVLVYCFNPFVGRQKDIPNYPKRCATLHNGRRWKGWVRCWSMDKERREYAAGMGDYVSDCGVTDVAFHDTDTGGFDSPAQWALRCDACRKRWGDDFAAATINKYAIFRDEIKKRVPDARFHFTFYPYNISVLTPKGAEAYMIERYGPGPGVAARAEKLCSDMRAFWSRLNTAFPRDVTFCIRETTSDNVNAFKSVTKGHGVFTWYKCGFNEWGAFFDETPRFIPTFRSAYDDVVFPVTMNLTLPAKTLAAREYSWNINAPGAGSYQRHPERERYRHAEAMGDLYDVVLPHIARNLFGGEAAADMAEAIARNVAPNQIFGDLDRGRPILTTHKLMQWQADEATRGAAATDRLYEKFRASTDRLGMDRYGQRRFVFVREVMHCSMWMAKVRGQNLLARELAKKGKLDDARKALVKGRELIAAARLVMEQLVAERPPDPLYNAPPSGNDFNRRWRLYTPVWGMDLNAQEKVFALTTKELPALAATGSLSKQALAELARRRSVHVLLVSAKPRIDGALDEADWQSALPAEAFWVHPEWKSIARAHTQARLMSNDNTLYLGVKCWTPAKAPVQAKAEGRDAKGVFQDDHVELFLWPQAAGTAYYHLGINANGSAYDVRHYEQTTAGGGSVKRTDVTWDIEGLEVSVTAGDGVWTLEAAIPVNSFGRSSWKRGWRVNIGRYFADPVKDGEWSAVMQPGGKSFHDKDRFLSLGLSKQKAPAPLVDLSAVGVKARTQTMDDRVATIVDYGVELGSTRVLHNVRITVEALDATGKTHFKREAKRLDHVAFQWRSQERITFGFERVVKQGAVRLRMESDEATAETLVRIGGWLGTEEVAAVFAPPTLESAAGDFRSTPSLAAPCYLPGTGGKSPILARREGTVEFWLLPNWGGRHSFEQRTPWAPTDTFLHSGVMRRDHPKTTNRDCFVLYYLGQFENVYSLIRNDQYAGWTASASAKKVASWSEPGWRHVAYVWDAQAAPDAQIRIYLNGQQRREPVRLDDPKRLGNDTSVRLSERPFAIQLLSLNTGRLRCLGLMDELRISRVVRYDGDFKPSTKPIVLDRDTSALFSFDNSLDGRGMTADGKPYVLTAVPGALEYQ